METKPGREYGPITELNADFGTITTVLVQSECTHNLTDKFRAEHHADLQCHDVGRYRQ
jgi:hypothetical protein